MKIIKTKEIVNRINELNDINELNNSLSDIFISSIGTYDEEIINLVNKSNDPILDFSNEISYSLKIDLDDNENRLIWNKYFVNSLHLLDTKKYEENPYNILLKNININYKNYSLKMDRYLPYEIFSLNDIKVDNNYIEKSSLGFFNKPYSFISLQKDNITWMSLNPNEIETMQKDIDTVSGKVLVLGLGLGYFPFMISNKDNVHEITIIENDDVIIKLFNENIFPKFKHKEKIKIIKADALEYIKNNQCFDYIFADLWHSNEDGIITFLKIKKYDRGNILYWLNNSFYALLRRAFLTLLNEQLNNFKDYDYIKESNIFDYLVNSYFKVTKNVIISSVDDINKLITDKSLMEIALSFND